MPLFFKACFPTWITNDEDVVDDDHEEMFRLFFPGILFLFVLRGYVMFMSMLNVIWNGLKLLIFSHDIKG